MGFSVCSSWAPEHRFVCTILDASSHVGSSQTRDQTPVPFTGRQILNHWTTREVPVSFFCWRLLFICDVGLWCLWGEEGGTRRGRTESLVLEDWQIASRTSQVLPSPWSSFKEESSLSPATLDSSPSHSIYSFDPERAGQSHACKSFLKCWVHFRNDCRELGNAGSLLHCDPCRLDSVQCELTAWWADPAGGVTCWLRPAAPLPLSLAVERLEARGSIKLVEEVSPLRCGGGGGKSDFVYRSWCNY